MRDNPRYEYALAVTASEEGDDGRDDVLVAAAGMAREALRAIHRASDGNPEALRICMMRAAGLSLSEMGAVLGIRKQSVHKRLRRIARRHPLIADYIMRGNPLDLYTEISDYAKKEPSAE